MPVLARGPTVKPSNEPATWIPSWIAAGMEALFLNNSMVPMKEALSGVGSCSNWHPGQKSESNLFEMHHAIVWKGNGFPNYVSCKIDQFTQAQISKTRADESLVGSFPIDRATCVSVFPIARPPLMASLLGVPVVEKAWRSVCFVLENLEYTYSVGDFQLQCHCWSNLGVWTNPEGIDLKTI